MGAGEDRILRLVGDGKGNALGGGLTLSRAFLSVLEYLLDADGAVSQEILGKQIMNTMDRREERVLEVWGSWDWFTDDIITQLGSKGILQVSSRDDAPELSWKLGAGFTPGTELTVISRTEVGTARGDDSGSPERVTVYGKEERADREVCAVLVSDLNKCISKIRRAGKLSSAVESWFAQITAQLEGGGDESSFPDLPDEKQLCPGCNTKKAKTRDNFVIYTSRGKYYWRKRCTSCAQTEKSRHYQQTLLQSIRELTVSEAIPTAEAVWMKMKEHGIETEKGSVVQSWDRLARRGDAPFR